MSGASFANDGDARKALSRNERYEFGLMARYPHVLERVIAESTDSEPPSRRKVLMAIRAERQHERERHPTTVRRRLRKLISEFGLNEVCEAFVDLLADEGSPS